MLSSRNVGFSSIENADRPARGRSQLSRRYPCLPFLVVDHVAMDYGDFSWAATSELVIRSNSLWSTTGFSVAFRIESSSNAILAGVSAVMHAPFRA